MTPRTKDWGSFLVHRVSFVASQAAAKAVKPKVEPHEVARYESYDARHGAKYVAANAAPAADDDEDDDWRL